MKKNKKAEDVFAEEESFDKVIGKLLRMDPIPMKKIKTQGKRGSKAPMFRPKP